MREETERQEEATAEGGGESGEAGAVSVDADALDGSVTAEVEELRGELEQLNDRHLRLAAEFDNYRKRIERDRQTLVARLQVDLVSSLLDVIDDLERVADVGSGASAEAVAEGVRLVEKKFLTILAAAGLEPVDADGEVFDPAIMEAVATVPTDDPAEEDVVADVFQRGYRVGDILVRPARVRVRKYQGPAAGSE
jgi:molecular chaperone GrpE